MVKIKNVEQNISKLQSDVDKLEIKLNNLTNKVYINKQKFFQVDNKSSCKEGKPLKYKKNKIQGVMFSDHRELTYGC